MRPLPDTASLRTLVVLAETGSVRAAGGRLGRTQSAVSMQLQKLEADLGVRLFDRHARGVTPTEAGARLVGRARHVLDLLADGVAAVSGPALSGPVRLGIPEEFGQDRLPSALRAFMGRHPGVELEVHCAGIESDARCLDEGGLDLLVTYDEPGARRGTPLGAEPLVWAAAADRAVARARPVPVALFDRACWWRDLALDALDRAGLKWRPVLTSPSTWGVRAAVAAGVAVGLLGASAVPPGAVRLGPAEGFPALDPVRLSLALRPPAGEAARSLAAVIREAFER